MNDILNRMKKSIEKFIGEERTKEIFGQITLHFENSWFRIVKYDNNQLYINAQINFNKLEIFEADKTAIDKFLKFIESYEGMMVA